MSELLVADDETWQRSFGITPGQIGPEPWVRGFEVVGLGPFNRVGLWWDLVAASVQVRMSIEDLPVVDLTRELATLVTVADRVIVIEYGSDGFRGRIRLALNEGAPAIEDALLRI